MGNEETGGPLYQEVQHFRQAWLWIPILSASCFCIYAVVQQMVLDKPFGNNPAPDTVLVVIAVLFGLGLPVLFYLAKLTTEVRSDGLYVRYFPFHLSFRKTPLDDLAKYEVRTYSALRDYGGWGIRHGWKGKAYNVRGNRGVQLELRKGGRVLIGSQKPEELAEAIDLALRRKGRGDEGGSGSFGNFG